MNTLPVKSGKKRHKIAFFFFWHCMLHLEHCIRNQVGFDRNLSLFRQVCQLELKNISISWRILFLTFTSNSIQGLVSNICFQKLNPFFAFKYICCCFKSGSDAIVWWNGNVSQFVRVSYRFRKLGSFNIVHALYYTVLSHR